MAKGRFGMMVDVIGEEKVIAAIDALEKKLKRKILSKALRAAAKIQLRAARQMAPVRTGRLRDSLKVRVAPGRNKKRGGKVIKMGVYTGKKTDLGITDDTYYPAYLEYGSSKMPAQPFMRPAFEASAAESKQAATQIIKRELKL